MNLSTVVKLYISPEDSDSTTGTAEPSANNMEPQTVQGEISLHQFPNQNNTTNEVTIESIISV